MGELDAQLTDMLVGVTRTMPMTLCWKSNPARGAKNCVAPAADLANRYAERHEGGDGAGRDHLGSGWQGRDVGDCQQSRHPDGVVAHEVRGRVHRVTGPSDEKSYFGGGCAGSSGARRKSAKCRRVGSAYRRFPASPARACGGIPPTQRCVSPICPLESSPVRTNGRSREQDALQVLAAPLQAMAEE